MPTCSLECTPQAGVDGVSLYYNQYGECYTHRVSGSLVCAVRFELGSTDLEETVAINLYPMADTDDLVEEEPTLCPSTSGAARWSDEGGGHVVVYFVVPTATNTEWGWDYSNQDTPPKLNIKVRVKRT